MSSKGLVKASITELEKAVRSRESKKNFKKGTSQNKKYYKSLSFLIGSQVRLKYIWIHEPRIKHAEKTKNAIRSKSVALIK